MLDFPRWKLVMILLVTFFTVLLAVPNFVSDDARKFMEEQVWLPHKTVSLGLDLQGGVHLLLEADTDDVAATKLKNLAGSVRDTWRDLRKTDRVTFQRIRTDIETNTVHFSIRKEENIERTERALRPLTQPSITGGAFGGGVKEVEMDQDGLNFSLTLTEEGLLVAKRDALQRAMEVVRRRIDPDGTREITVQRQGDTRIVIEVPGADNAAELVRIISRTAKLTFHDVDTNIGQEDIARGRTGAGIELVAMKDGGMIAIKSRVIVSGDCLTNASATYDQNNQPAVSFRFSPACAAKFGAHTQKNVGRPFAIKLDDLVISAPTIISPILGGSGQITGVGDIGESRELAILLQAGSLPVPLKVMLQSTVGPDLGADSIAAGKMASVIGLIAVVVFMALSYGRFGIAANVALIINLLMILGLLSMLQATLTLPGIAGIVLTIGMAVDANVLVFERIREEQKGGRNPFQAMEAGYRQAISTIMDANITTFIAAAVLYMLGSGPVQGFAVTLALGIMTSMFSAVLLTRLMLATWLKRARPTTLPI